MCQLLALTQQLLAKKWLVRANAWRHPSPAVLQRRRQVISTLLGSQQPRQLLTPPRLVGLWLECAGLHSLAQRALQRRRLLLGGLGLQVGVGVGQRMWKISSG